MLLSTSPRAVPRILRILFPRRVAYQHVLVLHQCFMFFNIALSKVYTVLWPQRTMQSLEEKLDILATSSRKYLGILEEDGEHSGRSKGFANSLTFFFFLHCL